MRKLAIAIVGPGLIGTKHLELVERNPATSVAAIVAPPHPKHRVVARRFGAPLYHDVATMLGSQRLDGCIISSPNRFHVDQATLCLEAGVPVLVEKPIADSLDAGDRLLDVAKRTNVALLVGHHRAHSSIMRRSKEIIDSDRLGRIVAVIGSAMFYKPEDYFEAGPWRKELGGGPILINLIHEVGNLRALCGEIVRVQAIASSATRRFVVEDTAAINCEFASGALGVFMLSDTAASARSWEQTSRENPTYPHYDDEDCYVISGTYGTLSIPSMRLKFYSEAAARSWWKPFSQEQFALQRDDPLSRQLENFVGVIMNGEKAVVSGFDGLQNLRVVEAIFQSIKSESAVKL
jgi:predicted dehydrogenase